MTRSELEGYISEKYGVTGERMWESSPSFAVFRHQDNQKWFAVIMRIPISKFGIFENREVNVVNLKCLPEVMDNVWQDEGIFPAYHMNKNHWISILLDGSVPQETVKMLTDASFLATQTKKRG